MKIRSLLHKWPPINLGVATAIYKSCFQRVLSQRAWMLEVSARNTEQLIAREARQQNLGRSMRTLSTVQNACEPKTTHLAMSQNEIRQYMAIYPEVVRDLTLIAGRYKGQDAAEWFRKALQYNLSVTSTKNSLITILTYKTIVKGDQLTAEKLRLAHILGWCLELLHCIILITDDIVDNSTTRRGQPSWYKLKEVGLNAINDVLMIENGAYELLKKYFNHLDCYVELLELFHQSILQCMYGQALDLLISKRNVRTFTRNKYDSIVFNKTSSHFFYLPIAVGLHLAGVKDRNVFDECKTIAIELGNYCQVQNDFLDCFGDPEATGKIGTDIQANKCSWLAVVCMEQASPEQKAILEECYGQNDLQQTARVKQIYEELNIPSIYAKYETETCNMIKKLIQQTSVATPRQVLLEILNTISKREIK